MFWRRKRKQAPTAEKRRLSVNRNELEMFYHNSQKSRIMGLELLDTTKGEQKGESVYTNYIDYYYDQFHISIMVNSYYGYVIDIYIDNVRVYIVDRWADDLPQEAKEYVCSIIDGRIRDYNQQCKENCVHEKYKKFKKEQDELEARKASDKRNDDYERVIKYARDKHDNL